MPLPVRPPARRFLALALLVAALGSTSGDLASALAAHLDGRCCHDGVCCCRRNTDDTRDCLRSICPCGGHEPGTAHTTSDQGCMLPSRFRVIVPLTACGDGPRLLATPSAGHVEPADHPPPSSHTLAV